MAITGGYLVIDEPFVRHGVNRHTACDLSNLGQYAIQAVNIIQNVPWTINPFILDTARGLVDRGQDIEGVFMVSPPHNPDHPTKPHTSCIWREDWESLSMERQKEINTEKAKVRKEYEEALGEFNNYARTHEVAEKMAGVTFWFPHNMDFRTRIYPIPAYLQPQGCDFAKGLLRFAQGVPLGSNGLYWLKSVLAAHWGEDKLSHEERNGFVDRELTPGKVGQWVHDPAEFRGWMQADKPWQFLAAAYEYVWALRTDPEEYVSYLPGNLDGSCNGAQHLSILGRDMVGAIATNCTKDPQRHDLYATVADRVFRRVMSDTNGSDSEEVRKLALEWLPKLESPKKRRDVVKRAVMTVPYGVTERGVGDFMKDDGHTKGMSQEWPAAVYMRDHILSSIGETLNEGRALQLYFAEVAEYVASEGKPLQWDTPAGVKVTQAYYDLVDATVQAFNTKYSIMAQQKEGETLEAFHGRVGLKISKMAQAASPNVIHSCDAAHLQITTVRCRQAGITNFSMIHDSYGVPFAQMELMRDILRQSIVDMYSDDYLAKWTASVEQYSGLDLSHIKVPEKGSFDITEILEAEFFFS